MKFQQYLEENQISLWKDFYINYSLLKKILKPIHKLYKMKLRKVYLNLLSKEYQKQNLKNPLLNIENEMNFLDESIKPEEIAEQFHNQIILEVKKVEHFFKQTLQNRILTRFNDIKEQIEFAKLHITFDDYLKTFELAIKQLYREVTLLKDFVDLNMKAKGKILKKFHKMIRVLLGKSKNSYYEEIDEEIEDFIQNNGLKDYENSLKKISYDISKLFSHSFSGKNKDSSIKILKNSVTTDQFSLTQSFIIGMCVGIIIFESIIVYCVTRSFHLSVNTDLNMHLIFPVFRALFLFSFYFIFLGLNFYIWNRCNLSFRIIFNISAGDNSETYNVVKFCVFLLVMLFTSYTFYIIHKTQINFFGDFITSFPNYLSPAICWLIVFIYLIFELNGGNMLTESLKDIFNFSKENIDFRTIWVTEQIISLIPAFRGILYTFCFYNYNYYSEPLIHQYCSFSPISNIKYFVITLIPLFIRLIQCIIVLRYAMRKRIRYTQRNQTVNIMKFILFITVSSLSFYSVYHPNTNSWLEEIWGITIVFTAIFSFFCDVWYDYNLFRGRILRKKLCYSPNIIYYFGIFFDLIFRLGFMLVLSPEYTEYFFGKEVTYLATTFYILEIIRRFIWNCFKIEVKHIEISNRYQLSTDVKLPYDKDESGNLYLSNGNNLNNNNNNNRNNSYIHISSRSEGERVTYSSRFTGDVENIQGFDVESLYEIDLANYLKGTYYERTKINLGKEMAEGILDITINE